MPSPFPGMDPCLESSVCCADFHTELITCLRKALNEHLPDNYDARIEERVTVIDSSDKPSQRFVSDVAIGQESGAATSAPSHRAPT